MFKDVGDDIDLLTPDFVVVVAIPSPRDLQPSLLMTLTLSTSLVLLGLVGGSKLTPDRSLTGLTGAAKGANLFDDDHVFPVNTGPLPELVTDLVAMLPASPTPHPPTPPLLAFSTGEL